MLLEDVTAITASDFCNHRISVRHLLKRRNILRALKKYGEDSHSEKEEKLYGPGSF